MHCLFGILLLLDLNIACCFFRFVQNCLLLFTFLSLDIKREQSHNKYKFLQFVFSLFNV